MENPGVTEKSEPPSKNCCSKCGQPIIQAEAITYAGRCEDCFATAEARRQAVDKDRMAATDNTPHYPAGVCLRARNGVPGVRSNEEVDYFGKHAGR